MILGEDKRECMGCSKMISYEDFDYTLAIDDDGDDPCHHREYCLPCYLVERQAIADRATASIQLKQIEPVVTHARQCPKCTSKTGCGCDDMDSDGYK